MPTAILKLPKVPHSCKDCPLSTRTEHHGVMYWCNPVHPMCFTDDTTERPKYCPLSIVTTKGE